MSQISSVRYGHATNSSSSHSIVACRTPERLPDGTQVDEFSYGWEEFVLRRPEEKAAYLLTNDGRVSEELEESVLRAGREHGFDAEALLARHARASGGNPWEYGIDHESMGTGAAPRDVSIGEWVRVVMDDRVVILGGNDNVSQLLPQRIVNEGRVLLTPLTGYYLNVKRDGDAIIFHDAESGMKFRWSETPYEKASRPELVDVKITDRCAHGCAFCYQGSTPDGEDAPLDRVKQIIDTLAEAGVFEMAIGGGEPTEHPDFAEILLYAAAKGVTPNFTTFSDAWAGDEAIVAAIKQVGRKRDGIGIGVSVLSEKDIAKLEAVRDAVGDRAQVIGQTVVGVAPVAVTSRLVRAIAESGNSVLLLGYKSTGRGEDFSARLPSLESVRDMIDAFRTEEFLDCWQEETPLWSTLSVDTAFLDQYGKALDELGVEMVLRTSPEGAFSMYIDAVSMTAGPSSWHPEQLRPVADAAEALAMFSTLDPVPVRGDAAEPAAGPSL